MPPPPVTRPVILIVDDEPDIADSLRDLLRGTPSHPETVAVTSAAEAMHYTERNRVDLVIADYRMPNEDGVRFLERLRQVKPDVPTILITGYPNPDVLVDAVNRAKIKALLIKPLDVDKLLATVEELLRTRSGSTGRIPVRLPDKKAVEPYA